jgi:hypothetical protein
MNKPALVRKMERQLATFGMTGLREFGFRDAGGEFHAVLLTSRPPGLWISELSL